MQYLKPFKWVKTNDWYYMELFVFESLRPFNYVQTIVIFMYNQISSDSLKDKITNNLLTYRLCITI